MVFVLNCFVVFIDLLSSTACWIYRFMTFIIPLSTILTLWRFQSKQTFNKVAKDVRWLFAHMSTIWYWNSYSAISLIVYKYTFKDNVEWYFLRIASTTRMPSNQNVKNTFSFYFWRFIRNIILAIIRTYPYLCIINTLCHIKIGPIKLFKHFFFQTNQFLSV